MKLISWNVNGVRAVIKKGFCDFLKENDPDIMCIQETKADLEVIKKEVEITDRYKTYWNSAEKKGYSGVAIFTKIEPLSVIKGIETEADNEGRELTLEFEEFFLVNAYFVNAKRGLLRLDGKIQFNNDFLRFTENLRKQKPVVMCGDFNVAHKEIDLTNPKSNEFSAGFSKEERESFTEIISKGYIDTFREFEKGEGQYTWWSYMFHARAKDIGWRLDYFLITENLRKHLKTATILKEIMGSDHCPVQIEMEF
jgi:exodeoxyribonuclease-3